VRRVAVFEAWTAEEVWALIGRLGARTLVFDVEPLARQGRSARPAEAARPGRLKPLSPAS